MSERHAFRAQWCDYNQGIFFVTICSKDKKYIFGNIANNDMQLSPTGIIVTKCVQVIPEHHPTVEVLNHVVMPNHIHMVISVGAQYIAPTSRDAYLSPQNIGCLKPPKHGLPVNDNHFNSQLAVIVRTFKAACTREYKEMCRYDCNVDAGAMYCAPTIWQRSFHEHIIRDQRSFENIMYYIDNNVLNWDKDCFYNIE